ncbi:MAG: 50S ribosomal protein L25 [Spirochaetaceae bacterium]|nr:MAG: 50S ribosomal protein L25 [Spirochaetaceae bacterium]
MEQKTLAASLRKTFGSAHARRQRRNGKIPAVIYGHSEPKGLIIDAHEFNTKFMTISESTIINLKVDGDNYDVLIRDYQEDTISGAITHVDFYEIERGKALRTNVGLHLTGTAVGIREGGILEGFVHELEVECLPKDLPEFIEVDITNLEIGHSIHIRDIEAPSGVHFLNSPDQVICTIAHKRIEVEEVAEELEAEALEAEEAEEEAAEEQAEE